MTTTVLAPGPAPSTLRARSAQRGHRLAAAALVLTALSIPVTGTGRAIAAEHAPAHVRVAAVADSLPVAVATGKNDV